MSSQQIGFFMLFQSTLPARGATVALLRGAHGGKHFNPRSPHGERLHRQTITTPPIHFNPRSPHGERRVVFLIHGFLI